ncbi:MAG: HAMP domain-containing sensor histidine kinase [Bacteroidota bacterium]|nr:HAMP domain-containing sensor histidine kinase [Bacteroidota bacterium]
MKIRLKITLMFTLLTTIVLLFSFTFIYFLSARYTERDFFERLQEKANLVAWKHFEQDEMSKPVYEDILERNNKNLPEAQEIVLNTADSFYSKNELKKIFPAKLINKLMNGEAIQYRIHERQCFGFFYPDNQGNFIVIVSAVDKYGIQKQKFLFEMLLIIFLGSIVFMFLMGQLYAKRVMSPVAQIMKNVRNIRATNLSLRLVEMEGTDELAELTRMFNQMLERLEEAFTMQKNFISNASHELKNPLTAILGEAEIVLGKKRNPEEYISTLNRIVIEAERLDLLTKNLLGLAQANSDLTGMKREKIQFVELLWEIDEYFDNTSYSDRIQLVLPEIDENYKPLVICGVHNLLKIALMNLVDNACKFSGKQLVNIKLIPGKDSVNIEITDKGIGIPDQEINNLFQPFFRASNTVAFKGSGIGLSLADKIVKLHNGTIEFYSIPGKGTRVNVHFPLDQVK